MLFMIKTISQSFKPIVFSAILVATTLSQACQPSQSDFLNAVLSQPYPDVNLSDIDPICIQEYLSSDKPLAISLINSSDLLQKLRFLADSKLSIDTLDLSFNDSDLIFPVINDLLNLHPSLNILLLDGSGLPQDQSLLAQFSSSASHLTGISMVNVMLLSSQVGPLMSGFSDRLLAIDLSKNPLGDDGIVSFFDWLESSDNSMRQIALNYTKGSDLAVKRVVSYARKHPEVQIQYLGNFYSDAAVDQEFPKNVITQ